jgi:hypothetical protein
MTGGGKAVHHPTRPTPNRFGVATVHGAAVRAQSRFRVAQVALLAQGISIGVLGGVALAWSMASVRFVAEGTPLVGLALTPMHGELLMASGVLTVLACLGRWSTVVFGVVATAGWAGLAICCAVRTANHTPGLLGFDTRDTVFDATLAVYNLLVCLVLVPTLMVLWRTRVARRHLQQGRRGD